MIALSSFPFFTVVVTQLEQILQNDVERYRNASLDSHASYCNIAKYTTLGKQ